MPPDRRTSRNIRALPIQFQAPLQALQEAFVRIKSIEEQLQAGGDIDEEDLRDGKEFYLGILYRSIFDLNARLPPNVVNQDGIRAPDWIMTATHASLCEAGTSMIRRQVGLTGRLVEQHEAVWRIMQISTLIYNTIRLDMLNAGHMYNGSYIDSDE